VKRMSLVAAAAALVASTVAVSSVGAQAVEHPIIGVWSLDREASSYSPGSGPMGQRRQFRAGDDGFVYVTRITVAANGNPTFALTRMKFDGQDYEVWGMANLAAFLAEEDQPRRTAAFEMVGERSLRLTQKSADGEVGPLGPNMWEVSADGSTLTVTTSGTNANGDRVHNVEVYNRVEN
jgi:hypothetical protein